MKLFSLLSIRKYVLAHKILSAAAFVFVFLILYFGYRSITHVSAETKYVLAPIQKGTVIVTVSGSGQVSASSQVDLKPKASGDVIAVYVKQGDSVRSGQTIVALDSSAAQKSVRDAEANLESTKLSLTKLQQPADALSLLQAENAVAQAVDAQAKARDDLQKSYDDAFTSVSNAFLDLPSVMIGLQDTLYGTDLSSGQWDLDFYRDAVETYDEQITQYHDDAAAKYKTARTLYDLNAQDYKSASRMSATSTIESLLNNSYETTKSIADAIKSTSNLIQFYEDTLTKHNFKPLALANTALANTGTYTAKANTHLSALLSSENAIQNNLSAIVNADQNAAERAQSLVKLKAGTDPLDIQSQQLSLTQRENALQDAEDTLANYTIRAPFDGIMAKVAVKKGDSSSSGTSAATIITKQKLAQVTLNEVDVSKVKVGEKATLTFDAIDGLSITGEVAEIDSIGTVTQGVVNYSVTIGFDTQDDRVKSGMSVSATIITDVKNDVLTVPNSAVKTQGTSRYVQILNGVSAQTPGATTSGVPSTTAPQNQMVETGLSSDTVTEITSGLNEGDLVIVRTVSPSSSTNSTSQTSGLRLLGGGLGGGSSGGGAVRTGGAAGGTTGR